MPGSSAARFDRADYEGRGSADLMATLRQVMAPSMGAGTVAASTLLDAAQVSEARHVILLVIDGLGSRQLEAHAPDGRMAASRVANMSSVFPSTTASAITTYVSAEPPSVHGLVGWHTWFPALGVIAAPLPFTLRGAGVSLASFEVAPEDLFCRRAFFPSIERPTRIIHPHHLMDTPYTAAHTRGALPHPYHTLEELFDQIERIARGKHSDFSYAYWPELDAISHVHGSMSEQAAVHLRAIDAQIARIMESIAGSGTLLMVTADHGFEDTTEETRLRLASHPELASMLLMPLSGEPRSVICHLRSGAREEFRAYVSEHLGHACELRCARELVAGGHLGPLVDAHPELAARLGDFVLLMKPTYCLVDRMPAERPFRQIGVHGGMSDAELRIPLIVSA